ncbi:MAG: DUF2147 domain-containing protein [Candidatus Cloacimonetes bacterium]|nr:DUF2147 domain-containing protein [Candidatus Cloacimonadota bacterium]MDD2423175.1 DUF2147 domain-containing protein [Candidatus Cloacimonadota bacterium]MDD3562399.1 DUF2147 domain-containing protein [Candidatus Cloacimonadota bacterium]MDD4276498.1 DUF2147 domain-containing protein [Candidatus Cloacimonadota bacterium]MDY0325794.1 DUF2147 domain-containing protein [Candidatus Cloacimonadaceae bacterium]
MKKIIFILIALSLILPIFAQGAQRITGVWFNGEKTSKIEISKAENGLYVGHIVWLEEPNEKDGKPKTDSKNPDAKLRKKPLIGLQVLSDLKYDGKDKFSGGKIYDPKAGKTYSSKAEMVNNNTLTLRGYVGSPLFGRTDTWTRTKNE